MCNFLLNVEEHSVYYIGYMKTGSVRQFFACQLGLISSTIQHMYKYLKGDPMYKICLGRIVENKTHNQLKFLDILSIYRQWNRSPNVPFVYFTYNLVLPWKLLTLKFDVQVASKK